MKNERSSLEKPALVFVADLPDTPGWSDLSRQDQDWLLENTSNLQRNRKTVMRGEFSEMMDLYRISQFLIGKKMKMSHYIRALYKGRTVRTAQRKHKDFKKLVAAIPPPALKAFVAMAADSDSSYDRLSTAALGDIISAARELPALTASTEKAADKYLEQLDGKLLEDRQMRREGKLRRLDESMAKKFAANAVLNYLRKCEDIKTSAQKRKFLQPVIGWVMEAEAVVGTLRCHRMPIPDGILTRRGRPIMTAEEKRLAAERREAAKKKGAA
jgi:hypothetical protein